MLQAHFVYLLSQPFIYKALIPFSGKWGAESKHSTQFATGWVTAITFMICQSSAKSKYLHSFPPLPFFVSLGSCPYSLLLWVCGFVCLDYFFFLCCILGSFYCCTFVFTNLILQCLICHLSHPWYFSSLTCCFSSQKFNLGLCFSSSFIEIQFGNYHTHCDKSTKVILSYRDVKSWLYSPHCTFHTHDSLILQLEVCSY